MRANLEVRNSTIHGNGLFTVSGINKGAWIIDYTGEIIDNKEAEKRCELDNAYIVELDEGQSLDGSNEANVARRINHSCRPNCEMIQDGSKLAIFATRNISPDEELSIDYRYSEKEPAEVCRCGSDRCRKLL